MFTFDGKVYCLAENPETNEPELSPEDKLELNALFDEVVKFNPKSIDSMDRHSSVEDIFKGIKNRTNNGTLSKLDDGIKCLYVASYLYSVKNDYSLAEKYYLFAVELKNPAAITNYVYYFYLHHDFEKSAMYIIKAINCNVDVQLRVSPIILLRRLIKIHCKGFIDYINILNQCDKNAKYAIDELARLNDAGEFDRSVAFYGF